MQPRALIIGLCIGIAALIAWRSVQLGGARARPAPVVAVDSPPPAVAREAAPAPAAPPPAPAPAPTAAPAGPAVRGDIRVVNSSGRSGAYYLPPGYQATPVPLLVLLHGSNGSGSQIIDVFEELVETRRFAIVAPDSRAQPGGYSWEVGDQPGDVTEDLAHVMRCVEWVNTSTPIRVDRSRVLIAGYSGGGSSAPYIGSNRSGFTHFAVLHGGAFPGGLRGRRIPGWFSTGEHDEYRPPARVQEAVTSVSRLGFDVTFRTYLAGHELQDRELNELLDWWLRR